MRVALFVITAGVVAGLSGTALAQTSAPPIVPNQPTSHEAYPDHWFASAYLGSNFGTAGTSNLDNLNSLDIDNGSTATVNFGGEIGYVWGSWGAEFMANYSPNFEISDRLLQRRPRLGTYMVNAIAAVPIGTEHRFR